jgi:hypothetical protein
MGWQDYHLWEFEVGSHRYGDPDPEYETNPPTQRAAGVKLAALIRARRPSLQLCLRLRRQLAPHGPGGGRRAGPASRAISPLHRRRAALPTRRRRRDTRVRGLFGSGHHAASPRAPHHARLVRWSIRPQGHQSPDDRVPVRSDRQAADEARPSVGCVSRPWSRNTTYGRSSAKEDQMCRYVALDSGLEALDVSQIIHPKGR